MKNKLYENSKTICIIGYFVTLSFYLLFFSLNVFLSLEAVESSLTGNNLFISIAFTLLIIIAPEYIFSKVYNGLKENKNKKNVATVFSILGIFFAICFSLVSIWGTYESLYKITFGSVVTNEKKDNYQKELNEYKEKEKNILNSINKIKDKIIDLPAEYFKIRIQYENLLDKFSKELELLKLEKPSINYDNSSNLSIEKTFNDFGIKFSGIKFLCILLLLSSIGLEVVLIMLSYNLLNSFSYLYKSLKNKTNSIITNNELTNNLDYVKSKNIKFILDCLEKDNFTIKPIREIVNEKNVTIQSVLNIIKDLRENSLIVKNGKRLVLQTELATKLIE